MDYGIPLNWTVPRRGHDPMRAVLSRNRNRLHMRHEFRQVAQIAPEGENFVARAVNGDRAVHPDAEFIRHAGGLRSLPLGRRANSDCLEEIRVAGEASS